ncbi:MAG: prenyltransferase/squalene oxidase repeat-containing protein, partial [Isosphaeraceae bacterium]
MRCLVRPIAAVALAFAVASLLVGPAFGQAAKTKEDNSGFAEGRTGDVPEGAAELMTEETDQAITSGLAWLAKQQNSDGSFGSGAYRGNVAVTSLSALSFMASGSSPGRGPYGASIDRALQFVMDCTGPSGFISAPTSGTHGPMYSHGFGALFLAEAYGMTHRAEVRETLERAVRLIIDTQNGEGGWRYQPVR